MPPPASPAQAISAPSAIPARAVAAKRCSAGVISAPLRRGTTISITVVPGGAAPGAAGIVPSPAPGVDILGCVAETIAYLHRSGDPERDALWAVPLRRRPAR